MSAERIELGESASLRLPRELIYLYLLAPIVSAPILIKELFELSASEALRAIAGGYLPFLLIPAVLHPFYAHAMPKIIGNLKSAIPRFVLHAIMSALIAVSVAAVIKPIHDRYFCVGPTIQLTQWLLTCVVITWSFLLPGLIVQELRARAHATERRALEERQAALRAQIEAIQSRTNPHFLFNALNTIASLIPENAKLAETTLERLADILRYALQSSRLSEVALSDELRMLEDYLGVQKARFGERLQYSIEIEPGLEAVKLPPLLLQPLVENAVLHGVAERRAGGRVRLRVARHEGRVEVRVDDDGPGPGSSTHKGSGTSLEDLRARLRLLYGPLGDLLTEKNALGGFTARLILPIGALGEPAP